MPYSVYLVAYAGLQRDHHAIFVETNADHTGFVFQVSGTIQKGMTFNHKEAKRPDDSQSFVSKSYIGVVSEASYPRVQLIVESVPPPEKQFDGPKPLNKGKPLRRCQEWTAEAIQALKDEGIFEVEDAHAN